MAATVNARDLALAATSPRIVAVPLPTNVSVDFGSNVTGAAKPANNATVNRITTSATAPASPVNGDIWIDTSTTPAVVKTRISGAWYASANYTTNTNQLTDGAGLGLTALWASVTGTGKPANNADVTTTILAASGTSIVMTNAQLFKSAAGVAGVFIGSGGIFGKNASGVTTFSIDGATGAASFAGNLSTDGQVYAYGSSTTLAGTAAMSGYSTTASSYGVVGKSTLFNGVGGFAAAAAMAGVFGQNITAGGIGISGTASGATSYAGYFNNATGFGVYSTGWIESTKTIRSTGALTPTSGAGVEMLYSASTGILQAYNRSTSAYMPMYVSGSTVVLNGPAGGRTATLNASGFASSHGFGCNGKTPQTAVTVNAASTDLATVVALCNQLRAALIANGIAV